MPTHNPDPAILTSYSLQAVGPDAELIAACHTFGRVNVLHHSVNVPASPMTDDQSDDITTAWCEARDRVCSLPATTPEGRTIRAAVAFAALRFRVNWGRGLTWQEQADTTERLALESLLDAAEGDGETATDEEAAALTFEAMSDEVVETIPTPEVFLECARCAYTNVAVGVHILTKDAAELEAIFRETDQGNGGEAACGVVDDLRSAREWFNGFVETLDCILARALIVGSKIALQDGAG